MCRILDFSLFFQFDFRPFGSKFVFLAVFLAVFFLFLFLTFSFADDMQVLIRINDDLDAYRAEMIRDFKLHQDRVDTVLLKMSERATGTKKNRLLFFLFFLGAKKFGCEISQRSIFF